MEWKDKKVLVFGTGLSGIGAAGLLERVGACPLLYDGNEKVKNRSGQSCRRAAGPGSLSGKWTAGCWRGLLWQY